MTILNFSAIRNNTFNPTWIIEFLLNDVAIDLTDCRIDIDFKLPNNSVAAYSMSTEDDTILIVDAVGGQIQLGSQIIDIDAGKYNYDIRITFPSDVVKTYVRGVMTVIQDITDSIPETL